MSVLPLPIKHPGIRIPIFSDCFYILPESFRVDRFWVHLLAMHHERAHFAGVLQAVINPVRHLIDATVVVLIFVRVANNQLQVRAFLF